MNRRKALKNIGISFGSITFSTSILSILQSCQANELDWSPDFFTTKQISFIDRMFENIIPEAEFGIFVLTILNGYKSEIILDKLVQVIQESLGEHEDVGK